MDTVLLGKTVKAMYKLSGKTIETLSEETELSIDTINNFFYARLQKPSFIGVCKLVQATGHNMTILTDFMDRACSLPPDANITDEFAKYLLSVDAANASAGASAAVANGSAAVTNGFAGVTNGFAGVTDGSAASVHNITGAESKKGPAASESDAFAAIKEAYQFELDKLHKIIKVFAAVIVLLIAIVVVITVMALAKL